MSVPSFVSRRSGVNDAGSLSQEEVASLSSAELNIQLMQEMNNWRQMAATAEFITSTAGMVSQNEVDQRPTMAFSA